MEENKKIGRSVDRLIMGVILGGAIGSVLGLTLAPKKGKETRAIIKQKGQDILEKGKDVSQQFIKNHKETIGSAKYQLKKGGKSFLRWAFSKLKKEKSQDMPKATMDMESSDE